jgi:hypothetical protein
MIEVLISRVKRQTVLKRRRSDPNIMSGNRRSSFLQLHDEIGNEIDRTLIRPKHTNARLRKKPIESMFVLSTLPAAAKSSMEFRKSYKADTDLGGARKDIDHLGDSFVQVAVSVGVEKQPH